jgi:hypothetical protein
MDLTMGNAFSLEQIFANLKLWMVEHMSFSLQDFGSRPYFCKLAITIIPWVTNTLVLCPIIIQ